MFTVIYSKTLNNSHIVVNGRFFAGESELVEVLTALHEDGFTTTVESGVVEA